jgi:murein DD-endopeptidase MepM/ murein hydrolase activator NlpD
VQSGQYPAVFGKRKEPHTVIIARGDHIRHFTVRPWLVASVGCVVSAVLVGYLLATSYLVLRDDLIGATVARQARMQQAYEDRISALRAQVDRITSRQLLDQQLVENKVSELLKRQTELYQRHGRLGPLLERAGIEGAALPAAAPVPADRPDVKADAGGVIDGFGPSGEATALAFASAKAATWPLALRPGQTASEPGGSAADRADKLFVSINQSLRAVESEQIEKIATLAANAARTADTISQALEDAGLTLDRNENEQGLGGPYIAADRPTDFDKKVQELDGALNYLDAMRNEARALPIANPAPGQPVSSGFGVRKDPLLGTPALHSGLDFRAGTGTLARATAKGKVVHAGWNGGYGRMVEIDHGNGFTTRYAHLSKILVKKGDTIATGDAVGKVGSSGRSTGPHLHYEVRRNGDPLNPLRFLRVGNKLTKLL